MAIFQSADFPQALQQSCPRLFRPKHVRAVVASIEDMVDSPSSDSNRNERAITFRSHRPAV
jgi:hypothetical protein